MFLFGDGTGMCLPAIPLAAEAAPVNSPLVPVFGVNSADDTDDVDVIAAAAAAEEVAREETPSRGDPPTPVAPAAPPAVAAEAGGEEEGGGWGPRVRVPRVAAGERGTLAESKPAAGGPTAAT